MLIAGGNANNAGNAEVLYLNGNNSAGNRNRNISARLAVDLCVFGKLTLAEQSWRKYTGKFLSQYRTQLKRKI